MYIKVTIQLEYSSVRALGLLQVSLLTVIFKNHVGDKIVFGTRAVLNAKHELMPSRPKVVVDCCCVGKEVM